MISFEDFCSNIRAELPEIAEAGPNDVLFDAVDSIVLFEMLLWAEDELQVVIPESAVGRAVISLRGLYEEAVAALPEL